VAFVEQELKRLDERHWLAQPGTTRSRQEVSTS
jgi:hypothetical protein